MAVRRRPGRDPKATTPAADLPGRRLEVPYTRAFLTGKENGYLAEALASRQLAGNGPFTKRCEDLLRVQSGAAKVLLTHSGTAALEMAALLAGLGPGDEVVMPSYTFVSTANAFVLRGATPVFCDITPDTLNMDPASLERCLSPRTRAVVPVHYAGVVCAMEAILALARRAGAMVIEDAAHAILSSYRGRQAGSFGALAALSFHETKNVVSGEGGALLINDPALVERAEIMRDKGTNRAKFFRGEVDKYTWVDLGSSFLPGELIAAMLQAQLEEVEAITRGRLLAWDAYHEAFADLEAEGRVRRGVVPEGCRGNGHIYFLILPSPAARDRLIAGLRDRGIGAVFHYVPLHSSPAGLRYGLTPEPLPVTEDLAARMVRLPIWADGHAMAGRVAAAVIECMGQERTRP